jgi:hypothetical protein
MRSLGEHGPSRWDGAPGRLEVWYATATDHASGLGLWWHHELVAAPSGEAVHHGWIAAFPQDADPTLVRWGPDPITRHALASGPDWIGGGGAAVGPHGLRGSVDGARWDIAVVDDSPTLWTFPRAVWHRELLPAAQIVPAPSATFTGEVVFGDRGIELNGAGALARIYGHGNAQRWGWLHADLGGGDVCEVVAAVSLRPGLRALPPLAFVQLRTSGKDWPPNPALAAPFSTVTLDLPEWNVTQRWGRRRLRVRVTQPSERCVDVDYSDPDGAPAVCTNTELADADLVLERRDGRWRVERSWSLGRCAHAEIGSRPAERHERVPAR